MPPRRGCEGIVSVVEIKEFQKTVCQRLWLIYALVSKCTA